MLRCLALSDLHGLASSLRHPVQSPTWQIKDQEIKAGKWLTVSFLGELRLANGYTDEPSLLLLRNTGRTPAPRGLRRPCPSAAFVQPDSLHPLSGHVYRGSWKPRSPQVREQGFDGLWGCNCLCQLTAFIGWEDEPVKLYIIIVLKALCLCVARACSGINVKIISKMNSKY